MAWRRLCLLPRPYRRLLILSLVVLAILLAYICLHLFTRMLREPPFIIEKLDAGHLPVVIVEEHHEVLPYWFHAANSGHLQKSGNVLVHIDGHSDFALPILSKDFPYFRYPQNDFEIGAMMQFNDVFIMAAKTTGLFSTLIWVWPKWDSVNHDDKHGKNRLTLGWYNKLVDGKMTKDFCQCLTDIEDPSDISCFTFNRMVVNLTYNGDAIDSSKCHIMDSGTIIEVAENEFVQELNRNVLTGTRVVLDIDEDYFGVESSSSTLIDLGIEWNSIVLMDAYLELVFEVKTTQEEEIADRMMANVVRVVLTSCHKQRKCVKDKISNIINLIVIKKHRTQKLDIFRRGEKGTAYLLNSIASVLMKMTEQQLRTLIRVGFCSTTTPKSLQGEELSMDRLFQVCKGFNRPNDTAVIFHSPSKEEVAERLSLLDKIIHHSNFPMPSMVTVCRSVRDGYTPRKYFSEIESGILDIVGKKINTQQHRIIYDKDLLGGPHGWPTRHDRWLNQL